MARPVPPPSYSFIEVHPPSYDSLPGDVPAVDPDVKQPILEDQEEGNGGANAQRQPQIAIFHDARSLASVTGSLQPWSKLPHPASTPIPVHEWNKFVSELRSSVAPSGAQKALAVLAGTGVSLGTWTPTLGACVGGLVWKKAVEKRVQSALAEQSVSPMEVKCCGREPISQVVDRYNQMWLPLGVCVRLEGISKAEAEANMFCGCPDYSKLGRGCHGGQGGCCAVKCRTCGKWARNNGGKLRKEVGREILRVLVEKRD